MTEKQLEEFHAMAKQIRTKEEQIKQFREKIGTKSPALTGMPHGSEIGDKTAALATELADMEERLQGQHNQYEEQSKEIRAFIDQIDDDITRIVYRWRVLYGCSWQEVADIIGGYNTRDSVRARYMDYLKKMKLFIPKPQSWKIQKEERR